MRSILKHIYEQDVPIIRGAIREIPDYVKNAPTGLGANLKATASNAAQGIKNSLVQGARTANSGLQSASTTLNQTGVGQAVRAVGNIAHDEVKDTYDNVKNIAVNTNNLSNSIAHAGPDAPVGISKIDSLKNIAGSTGDLLANKI
jgi:hypothetical protein